MDAQLCLPHVTIEEHPRIEARAAVDEDALRRRVAALEAALARVQAECDAAHAEPTIVMTSVIRIHSVTRRVLGYPAHPAAPGPFRAHG